MAPAFGTRARLSGGLIWLFVVVCLHTTPAPSAAITWQEQTSVHFRVFYQSDSASAADEAAYAAEVVAYAEHYYQHIALGLGLTNVVRRDRVPWLGANRCRIYLYPDKATYVRDTGAPEWSGGFAIYPQRLVGSFVGAETFLNGTLPHELAHIIFREYVGFQNPQVPRWLDEGVADFAAIGRLERALELMPRFLVQGTTIPLTQLTQMRVEHAQTETVQVFYLQAATLVHFFLETYGTQRFITLCDALRDGSDFEPALAMATAGQVRSLSDLETDWYDFLVRLP